MKLVVINLRLDSLITHFKPGDFWRDWSEFRVNLVLLKRHFIRIFDEYKKNVPLKERINVDVVIVVEGLLIEDGPWIPTSAATSTDFLPQISGWWSGWWTATPSRRRCQQPITNVRFIHSTNHIQSSTYQSEFHVKSTLSQQFPIF